MNVDFVIQKATSSSGVALYITKSTFIYDTCLLSGWLITPARPDCFLVHSWFSVLRSGSRLRIPMVIETYAFIGLTLYQFQSLTLSFLYSLVHRPENPGALTPFSSCRVRPALPGHPDSLLSGQPVFCRTAHLASYGYHLWIMGRSV